QWVVADLLLRVGDHEGKALVSEGPFGIAEANHLTPPACSCSREDVSPSVWSGLVSEVNHTFCPSAGAIRMWERNRTHQIAPQDLTVDDVPCVYVEDHGNGKGHVG